MSAIISDNGSFKLELFVIDPSGRVFVIREGEELDLSANSFGTGTEIKVTRDPGSDVAVNIPVTLK